LSGVGGPLKAPRNIARNRWSISLLGSSAMIATVGHKVFVRGKSRLFGTVWLVIHATDALAVTSLAMVGKLNLNGTPSIPLEIMLPIVHPMKLTVANQRIDQISLEIRPLGTTQPPPSTGHVVDAFTSLHHRLIGIVYLNFYEQHRPSIESKYGGDTKAWPQIFQFAWLLRNGIAHHAGHINFTNQNYPTVTWHSFSYSPTNKGKPILGSHFSVADLLMFLFDLSDEFDAIGAPMPPD
jgi:hypothetical protein